jgi:hypothetical protein
VTQVRKRRWVWWLVLWLVVAVAALAVLYSGLHTSFFAYNLSRYATRRFLAGTPFTVSIDKLQGNPFGDFTVEGLTVQYRGKGGPFDLVHIDELRCRYDMASFVEKRPRIEELVVVKPILRLTVDSTGAYVLPSGGRGGGALPALVVERFSLQDGHAIIHGREGSRVLNGVQVRGSVQSSARGISLRIDSGSAENPERNLLLKKLSGRVNIDREPSGSAAARSPAYRVSMDSLAVGLEESSLVITGWVAPRGFLFDCTVTANPLVLDEFARLLGRDIAQRGEIEGLFSANGNPSRFRLRGTMNGVVAGYAMSDFRVDLRREPGEIRIDSMGGYLNGASIEGAGTVRERAPRVVALDLSVRGLDLSKGFVPKRRLPATDFNGTVSLRYRIPEEAFSFSLNLGAGHFYQFPFRSAAIRGSYARDTLAFDDILLTHPTHTVSARGRIVGDDRVDFVFNVDCRSQDSLFDYFDIEQYRADVKLDGIWQGTFDHYDLRMSGPCGNFVYRMVHIPAGTLKLAIEKDDQYRVFFDLDGQDCEIGPASFSSIILSLEYADAMTRIKKLSLSREGFLADAAMDITREGRVDAVRVRALSLDALDEEWTGGGRFAILIADSVIRFDDLQLHSRTGAIYVGGELAPRAKTLDVDVGFERLALDMLNRGRLVSFPIAGKAQGSIHCSGSLDDPDVRLALSVEEGRIDTFVVDSLQCRLDYAARRSVIDSFLVASRAGTLMLSGEVSGVSLAELMRRRGEGARGAVVNVRARCRELLVAPFFNLVENRTLRSGRFSGILSMSDSLAHPSLEVAGTVANLAVSSFTLPVINCSAAIHGDELAVEGTIDASGSQPAFFRGSIPLERAPFFYGVDKNGALSFDLEIPDGSFAALPSITDFVAEGAGTYAIRIAVSGTASDPHLRGQLNLGNVSCRLAGMEERYSQVNADVRIDDSLVTVSSIRGREGKKGTFDCSGSVGLGGWKPRRYDLSIHLKDFVLASVPDALAIVSGSLAVGTKVEEGRVLPVFSGSCVVNQSEVYYDLGSISASEGGATLEPPAFLAAVDLHIPGNTWIKTADARVELQGDITVYHDNLGTYVRGELNLVRGWYNVYNNKFQIDSGKLQFVHAGGFRPVVDIEAETRDPEGRTIYLTIQWHQDDIQPKLTLRHEDPGYSETDIWKMLGGGIVGTPDAQGGTWDARATAQNIATNYLERVLNSQMEGMTIELESPAQAGSVTSGALNVSDTKIAIGKYLSQGLYVKYKQGLSISTAREIDVEYRISNLLLLRSEVIRYSDNVLQGKSPGSTDEINLDVKLRWEF